MALPMVIAGIGAALAGLYAALPSSVQTITKDEFMRLLAGDVGEIEREVIQGAFLKLGLDIDPESGLNEQTITDAINNGPLAGSGVELTNIFDRDALKRDMQKVAMQYAAESFGIEVKGVGIEGIKEALRAEVSNMVRQQIGEGGGDLVDGAPDLVEIVRLIEAAQKEMVIDENGDRVKPPLDMSPHAIANRERQARYRAGHTRHWEPR